MYTCILCIVFFFFLTYLVIWLVGWLVFVHQSIKFNHICMQSSGLQNIFFFSWGFKILVDPSGGDSTSGW